MLQRLIILGLLTITGLAAYADDLPAGKSQYNLFNPTPDKAMRDWRTDQAGVSPYTLDAGHFEAEITALGYGSVEQTFDYSGYGYHDHYTDKEQRWTYGEMTLKAGLLNCLDAEISLTPYSTKTVSEKGAYSNYYPDSSSTYPYSYRETSAGFGNVSSRFKLNVWGNDEGATALSISGNVTFPTEDASLDPFGLDLYAGGPAVEFAAKLPCDLEMRIDSSMTFFTQDRYYYYYGRTSSLEVNFENLISFGHQIVGPLYGYCVFDTMVSTDSYRYSDWQAVIVPGLNYRLNKNFDIFVRSGFGVHGDVYDYSPSTGFNIRL